MELRCSGSAGRSECNAVGRNFYSPHGVGFTDGIMAAVGNCSTHSDSERSAMTSRTTTLTQGTGKLERFPDFPPREDMQNTSHLHRRSMLTALAIHIGNPETTLVHGEVPVSPTLDPGVPIEYRTSRGVRLRHCACERAARICDRPKAQ